MTIYDKYSVGPSFRPQTLNPKHQTPNTKHQTDYAARGAGGEGGLDNDGAGLLSSQSQNLTSAVFCVPYSRGDSSSQGKDLALTVVCVPGARFL